MPASLQELIRLLSPPGDTGPLDEYIKDATVGTNVDPKYVKAVADVESHFDPKAKSSTGAVGLMQLMPKTAETMGVKDRTDPYQNVEGGTRYLSELMGQFNTMDRALAAYHQGPGGVPKGNRSPTTNAYVNRVKGRVEAPKADYSPFSTSGYLSGIASGERPDTTPLTDEEEPEFRKWFAERASKMKLNPNPDDPNHYYDARGAWKAGHRTTTDHLPDTYKLPGHPSFSDESQYYKPGMKALPLKPKVGVNPKLKDDLKYFKENP